VLFSEPGADGARLLRQRLAAKRLGFLLTVFHDDTCPAPASRTPRRHACATPAWPRETQGTRSRCSTLARSRRRRPGNGCPRLAVLRTLDRAADVIAVGVTRRGDCVVTVWCPACGKRHVHRWPWDSVEPGARRPHRRFLSPNDYRIPRPARKLLAHLDAGPWSPAT